MDKMIKTKKERQQKREFFFLDLGNQIKTLKHLRNLLIIYLKKIASHFSTYEDVKSQVDGLREDRWEKSAADDNPTGRKMARQKTTGREF